MMKEFGDLIMPDFIEVENGKLYNTAYKHYLLSVFRQTELAQEHRDALNKLLHSFEREYGDPADNMDTSQISSDMHELFNSFAERRYLNAQFTNWNIPGFQDDRVSHALYLVKAWHTWGYKAGAEQLAAAAEIGNNLARTLNLLPIELRPLLIHVGKEPRLKRYRMV